jgi:carbamoyl-phosphate synthase small subunit
MVSTNAHIGNYGTTPIDNQSETIKIAGLICKNFSFQHTRPIGTKDLLDYFKEQNVVAISDVDTRALVRYIRDNGAMNALITTEVDRLEELKVQLAEQPSMVGNELASKVSTQEPYFYGNPDATYKVAAVDLGVKKSILDNLALHDVYIKVFPYDATFEELEAWNPDGYFLSNGPGDPEPLIHAQTLAKEIIKRDLPLFGICLGHQVIAIAHGISTFKMFNGHRGINHPVLNIATAKGEITSQNHGFAVNREEAEQHPDVTHTHTHLKHKTVAGLRIKNKKCFSVQYHPEASPGPNDSKYLFSNFVNNF